MKRKQAELFVVKARQAMFGASDRRNYRKAGPMAGWGRANRMYEQPDRTVPFSVVMAEFEQAADENRRQHELQTVEVYDDFVAVQYDYDNCQCELCSWRSPEQEKREEIELAWDMYDLYDRVESHNRTAWQEPEFYDYMRRVA